MFDEDKQSNKGPKQSNKGPKQSNKGPKQSNKGQPSEVAEDVFRQVTGLGGFLLVAFVSPMAPNAGAGPNDSRDSALTVLANKALEREAEATEMQRQNEEKDRKLVERLALSLKAQSGQSAKRPRQVKSAPTPSGKQRQQRWSLKSVKD